MTRDYNINKFGAVGNGSVVCTAAIQNAIDAAANDRETVVIPPGQYVCGTVHLRSMSRIKFLPGAVVIASRKRSDFLPCEFLGFDSYADAETTYSAYSIFYGFEIRDVVISGLGTVDGNGTGRGGPKPLAFRRCDKLRIFDITVRNAPNYSLSLLGCTDVKITSVVVRNAFVDGITVDGCRNVLIDSCDVQSANDAICLKSSLSLGYRNATTDVLVSRCVLGTQRSAFKIGSESCGDFRNISLSECKISSLPTVDHCRAEAGAEIQIVDGGTAQNINISNIAMSGVSIPIFVVLANRGRGQLVPKTGAIRSIRARNIVAGDASVALVIVGSPEAPIQKVRIDDMTAAICNQAPANVATEDIPEFSTYTRPGRFGRYPTYGLFCRHTNELTVANLKLHLRGYDGRPMASLKDVKRLKSVGIRSCINTTEALPQLRKLLL